MGRREWSEGRGGQIHSYVCRVHEFCIQLVKLLPAVCVCVCLSVQLIAAGVLDKRDYPGFTEESGILPDKDDDGSDDDYEVELVEEEPAFLRGQTKLTANVSPVRIVKVRLCTVLL